MSCNSPNRVFYTGEINEKTGKRVTFYTSRFTDYLYRRDPRGRWQTGSNKSVSADSLRSLGYQIITEHDDVPCQQCIGCRIDYARSWSLRIMNETEKYPKGECWFVTVTYNDEYLPPVRPVIKVDEDGVITTKISEFHSISLDDHQKFMKRLRKKLKKDFDKECRFFCALEYGDLSMRPHMHYILFGVPLNDLRMYKISRSCDPLYTSDWLSELWTDDNGKSRGFITVGAVTSDSASYCARYAIKKRKMKRQEFYSDLGIEPEKCVMSRRPGIGAIWFNEHGKSMYETDKAILKGRSGAIEVKIPKYYDDLMERMDPEKLESIKENRKLRAEQADNFIEDYLPLYDKENMLAARERKLESSIYYKKVRNVE